MAKHNLVTWVVSGLSLLLGGWLAFDGARKILTGFYTGEETIGLGLWASIVSTIGVSPADMAFPFVLLGTIWIVNAVIFWIGGPWRCERVIATSLLTLFYLAPGTIV